MDPKPLLSHLSVRPVTSASLIFAIAAAWLFVIYGPAGMSAGVVAFVVPWTAMMIAMMLPSAAPLVLLYNQGASSPQTALLTIGYLLVWALAGVPAYFAMELLPMSVGPIALALAGIYQLTPLKTACLKGCRSPANFLIERWGRGSLRLGAEHGLWCLGCCWALMMVLVLVGSMGLLWVLGLTFVVAVEKLTRHGVAWARVTGIAFLIAAIIQEITQWHGASMATS